MSSPDSPLSTMDHILELLRSNVLTDSSVVNHCLERTESDMQLILDQIHPLEDALESLRAKHQELERRASRYRSLLAPVRRIPPELLSYIFEFVCSEPSKIGAKMCCSPIQLSQVCTNWRNVVWSHAVLWSSFSISPSAFSRRRLDQMKFFLTMHVALSKQSLLSVTVDMPANIHSRNQLALFVVKTLVSQSARWREIALINMAPFEEILSESGVKGKLPLLRTLRLESGFNENFDAFEIAPSLEAFTSGPLFYCPIPLPWKQITTRSIRYPRIYDALQELLRASEANNVELFRCDLRPILPSFPIIPIIHHLRSLSIVVDAEDPGFHEWFTRLTLPHLSSLSIAGALKSLPDSCPSVFVDNCFPSFLSRSSCTITSLSLIDLPLPDDEVLALLAALPSLTSLTIHEAQAHPIKNSILTTRFFESLTIDHHAPSDIDNPASRLVKHLQVLDLKLHATLPARYIADLIESRCSRPMTDYPIVPSGRNLKVAKICVLWSVGATTLDAKDFPNELLENKGTGVQFSLFPRVLDLEIVDSKDGDDDSDDSSSYHSESE